MSRFYTKGVQISFVDCTPEGVIKASFGPFIIMVDFFSPEQAHAVYKRHYSPNLSVEGFTQFLIQNSEIRYADSLHTIVNISGEGADQRIEEEIWNGFEGRFAEGAGGHHTTGALDHGILR